jgi:DNA-binding NtrC family response regulator
MNSLPPQVSKVHDSFPMISTSSVAHRFLVIDENPDGRFLLSKTLLRAFPNAAVVECQSADTAFQVLQTESVAAILSHRTLEFDGAGLVRELRKINADVPIVMVSGFDREKLALEAGATRFFNYDQWPRIGIFIAELLAAAVPSDSAALAK